MRVTVVAAIAVITMLTSGAAMAAPMPYAELDAGALLDGQLHAKGADIFLGAFDLKEKHRVGGIFSGLVGRRIGDTPFAVEGEGLYLNSAIQSDDLNAALGASAGLRVQSYGGMANLKVEHPLASAPGGFTLSPFATGGVGYGQTDMTILGDHYAGGGLLWQAKAGLALRTSAAVSWTLAYRYVHIPGYDTNKLGLVARLENYADGVSVGVRYTFGAH